MIGGHLTAVVVATRSPAALVGPACGRRLHGCMVWERQSSSNRFKQTLVPANQGAYMLSEQAPRMHYVWYVATSVCFCVASEVGFSVAAVLWRFIGTLRRFYDQAGAVVVLLCGCGRMAC